MRSLIIAALALSASSAALAGQARAHGRVDAAEIEASVDAALERAMAAVRRSQLGADEAQALEAEINAAMAEVEIELAGLEVELADVQTGDEAAIDARVEAAMAEVEEALERASRRIEAAAARAGDR